MIINWTLILAAAGLVLALAVHLAWVSRLTGRFEANLSALVDRVEIGLATVSDSLRDYKEANEAIRSSLAVEMRSTHKRHDEEIRELRELVRD